MRKDQIWAPWRLDYILGDKDTPQPEKPLDLLPGADPGCFLCQCAVDDDDRHRLTVSHGTEVVVVMNRYPYNNGHLLIAPVRHLAELEELDDRVQLEISQTLAGMVKLMKEVLNAEGFNIGLNLGHAGGAGLPGHLHWHIVPRWKGDTNFMPSVAGIKVIPQSLEALWEALTEALNQQ